METIPVIVEVPLVMFSNEGVGRAYEKGDSANWPKSDFPRAEKSGLVRAAKKN